MQALSTRWHFTFALCCHSTKTCAQIANLPNSTQLGALSTIPSSYIQVRTVVWECGKRQTTRQTQTQTETQTKTCVSSIHFASSTTHAECNNGLHSAFTTFINTRPVRLGRFGFFNFGSIRFSISSIRFRFFSSFGICRPPQCKSIPVCENTKRESIDFHKKFQIKYIDRAHLMWSYSSHLVWSTPSHSAWLVPLTICHNYEEVKNR